MPSPARHKYLAGARKALILREVASRLLRRVSPSDWKQVCYHASLAASVAAWDAYIKEIIANFFDVTADPLTLRFNSVHTLARQSARSASGRFNTPDWEKSRNLLMQQTGYDPYSDWAWTVRGWTAQVVRNRLDEILKVRHSFAHGFALPALTWTQLPSGRIRLAASALRENEAFFAFLVRVTDKGISKHIHAAYGVATGW